jgi:O-antigen ligase
MHVDFQPTVSAGSLTLSLSDVAVLVVAAVALTRFDGRLLARPRAVWSASAIFLAYLFLASLYGGGAVGSHLVTAAKFAEYALLAPSVVVLVRTRRDLEWLLLGIVCWSAVCTVLGVAQYAGAGILKEWPAGGRQPSLLGIHEFASFSATALTVGLAALVRPGLLPRAATAVGIVSGLVGVVLAGSVAAGIGVALAAAGLALAAWRTDGLTLRRLALGAAVVVVAAIGVAGIRSGDIGQFGRFVGITGKETAAQQSRVQTYSQRTLISYIALREWRDNPVLGIGWQGAWEPRNFEPYLAAAHRRFPDQPAQAFPSRAHPYPIDNAYLQALAELGVVGLAVFVGWLATLLLQAARRLADDAALLGGALVLVAVGVWIGQGLVAGTPHDAVAWLAAGLVALGGTRA